MQRAMMIGAHPDDPEVAAGGLSLKYLDAGWEVMFVTMTNGDAGHHEMDRYELARRRKGEAEEVSRLTGIAYYIFDIHDGELMPGVEIRRELIGVIRRFRPDIVFSHPLMDYHPDHRYTSQIVMDTAYMLGVPAANPEVPAMRTRPVYAWYGSTRIPTRSDAFSVAVDIEPVWDRKVAIMAAHESQMFEWLPFDSGVLDQVPVERGARLEWLSNRRSERPRVTADTYRDRLEALYGEESGRQVRLSEAFIASPVSLPLTGENYREYFPFFYTSSATRSPTSEVE